MLVSVPPSLHAAMADKIVAVVNEEPVTQSEVDDILAALYFTLQKDYAGDELMERLEEARVKAVSQIIEDLLIYQEAEKKGVKITDEEIDELANRFKQQFASPAEMEEALAARGLTLKRLRQSYRKQIAIQKLHAYEVRSKIVISPSDVEAYYESHKDKFTEKGHWLLSCITLRKRPEDVEKGLASEEKKKLIEDLLKRIRAGEDFRELARRHSEDSYANAGGEMHAVMYGSLLPEVEAVISRLHVGEISDVIETESSYHIFRLDGVVKSKVMPLNEVRDAITDELYRGEMDKRYRHWMEELKKNSYISIK